MAQQTTDGCPLNLKLKDWSLDVAKFEEGALTVLREVRPGWSPAEVGFRYFTDGITNKLVGCFLKQDPTDTVLIRVNGEGTEVIIDREAEVKTFQLLSAAKCGPPLYALFKNGMSYGFFHGQPLDEKTVRDEQVATLIAQEMVRLHGIQPDNQSQSQRKSSYPKKAQSFLDAAPTCFDDPALQARFQELVPNKAALQAELNEVIQQLESLNMPTVFSHNDLLLKNIVYHEKESTIRFIDYEYAFLNYRGYDIGNHFCEYAGIDEVDYDLYPDKAYQLTWLRRYLEFESTAKGRSPSEVTELDVERFYVQVNKCACAAHFFWGIWALIQAKNSSIDFDFLGYSVTRLNEYFRRKKEFFPLTMP